MSETTRPAVGTISWVDLTVPDAGRVRDFYRAVVGWDTTDVEMGGYADYGMNPPGADTTVAGICHARGVNADLPAQWLVYITVEDLDRSLVACRQAGGRVLSEPKGQGSHGRYAVIQDPAGAVAALHEPA